MPATTGMKGAGYYDQHSSAQQSSIQALQGWVDDAVASLPLPAPPRPVTVGGLFPAGVYASAVGGSFYGPLLPPGTVHLATCFNAILWLDRLPAVPLPDGVAYRRPHPPRPGLPASPEVTSAFTRQAEQDLERSLECRARELVRGASCCWPPRAIRTRPAWPTGSMTSSMTPVSTWSAPAGWNSRSTNA